MQRHERIRFFITEQCRRLDPTYRAFLYPRQVFIGDTQLPLLQGSPLTFRINSKKKISFRIRLKGNESESMEGSSLNIGISLSQIESISIKDHSNLHPEAAMVFLLKDKVVDRLVQILSPLLDNTQLNNRKRRASKYLTVLAGVDPKSQEKPVYYRVSLLANKFTFPFKTAKKMMMNDLPIMWQDTLDEQIEKRVKTGVHHDRELMTEMDDAAWRWLMKFLRLRWARNVSDRLLYLVPEERDLLDSNNENQQLPLTKRSPPSADGTDLLPCAPKRIHLESTSLSPESSPDSLSDQ